MATAAGIAPGCYWLAWGEKRSGVVAMVTCARCLRSYSWWVLASLKMIKRSHWIDSDALRNFILACQVCGRMAERLGSGEYMRVWSGGGHQAHRWNGQ
jgi:hypothetical protein